MKIKSLLFLLTLLLCFGRCAAQPVAVEGIVLDESNNRLIGADIRVKGTAIGAVSDNKGYFRLTLADTAGVVLIVSYTGFQSREVPLSKMEKTLVVSLKAEVETLDQVVVTSRLSEDSAEKRAADARRRTADSGIAPGAKGEEHFFPPLPTAIDAAPAGKSDAGRARTDRYEAPAPKDAAAYDLAYSEPMAFRIPQSDVKAEAGTLTAGEIHDFSKWELWQDIAAEDLAEWREHWQVFPKERYSVQLTAANGQALVDCPVRLTSAANETIWATRTDNTGKAELWAGLFTTGETTTANYRLTAGYQGSNYDLGPATAFSEGLNLAQLPLPCDRPPVVDIAMVVDATGSMRDEIAYLKAELDDVLRRVQDTLPEARLRLGSVFYRDQGEEYLTRQSDLSEDISQTLAFIAEQDANGGGDTPEAVETALRVSLEELSWSDRAVARLLFLVLDAEPHHNPEVLSQWRRLTQQAARRGIRVIPLVCSGMTKSGEYLMRTLALASNGTYTFLTDDSGVGGTHLPPTTDVYDVEKLNALLLGILYNFAYAPACEPPAQAEHPLADTTRAALAATQFSYYPNPTFGPLTVEKKGDVGQLFLTDFTGKILERYVFNGPRLSIDLSRFPAGTYFLRCLTEDQQTVDGQVILVRS